MLPFDIVAQLGDQRRQFGHGLPLAGGAGQVGVRSDYVEVEIDQRLGRGDHRLPLRRLGADHVVRVAALGHARDEEVGVEPLLELQPRRPGHRFAHPRQRLARLVQPADRRLLAGGVGVQRQHEVVGEVLKLFQLLRRQRRPHAGDHVGEAELVRGDDIHVAFDDHHLLLLANGAVGQVEAIDHV